MLGTPTENIAQIYDLALEHVHGRDVRAIFRRHEKLGTGVPVVQALNIVMKLCAGLDYAHNRKDPGGEPLGLIHRDVSLHNVIVSFEGEVKIIDFGIAKRHLAGQRRQRHHVGVPGRPLLRPRAVRGSVRRSPARARRVATQHLGRRRGRKNWKPDRRHRGLIGTRR